jgi:hypothetical protein
LMLIPVKPEAVRPVRLSQPARSVTGITEEVQCVVQFGGETYLSSRYGEVAATRDRFAIVANIGLRQLSN